MNIAIVEDHLLVAQSLKNLLENAIKDCEIHIFTNAEDFLASNFKTWIPDIVLADLLLAAMDGIEMIEKVAPLLKEKSKFIILSSISDVHTIKNAIRIGANGYLAKESAIEELLKAIEMVQAGGQYIGQSLKESLINYIFVEEQIVFHLSPREKDVLTRICSGRTPKEIAFDMKLSVHTIQQYIKIIMRKFKVNRTIDLVVFAIQKGMYNPN